MEARQGAFYAQLGARLRQAREAKGLSQAQVGALLGVTDSAYNQWEVGRRRLRAEEVHRICRLLDIDVRWLLGEGSDDPDEPDVHDLRALPPAWRQKAHAVIQLFADLGKAKALTPKGRPSQNGVVAVREVLALA